MCLFELVTMDHMQKLVTLGFMLPFRRLRVLPAVVQDYASAVWLVVLLYRLIEGNKYIVGEYVVCGQYVADYSTTECRTLLCGITGIGPSP